MKVTTWTGCYSNQWQNLIVPDAFSHPAKFSPGLIQKIYAHGIERGYFKKGQVVGDPFGGIGGGGIFAAYAGLDWIGVELEQKFVELTMENFQLHLPVWEAHSHPLPLILRGDSRRFSEIIGECDCIATSPPFSIGDGQPISSRKEYGGQTVRLNYKRDGIKPEDNYGKTEGQIGTLKAGDLDAVVTSPPYADSVNAQSHGIDWTKVGPETGNRKRGPGCKHGETFDAHLNYSTDPANIGNLKVDGKNILDSHTKKDYNTPLNQINGGSLCENVKIAEPKFQKKRDGVENVSGHMSVKPSREDPSQNGGKRKSQPDTTESQTHCTTPKITKIGKMETTDGEGTHGEYKDGKHLPEMEISVPNAELQNSLSFTTLKTKQTPEANGTTLSKTSKSYAEHATIEKENQRLINASVDFAGQNLQQNTNTQIPAGIQNVEQNQTPKNITGGKESETQTYWSEMTKIYRECWLALKPGGYLIVVLKSYIKNKRRIPLPMQTLKLLIHLGFEPVERIKAMLTEETVQGGLFGKDIVKTKSRKSFFRRLAENRGSPKIDWEEVLVCRKQIKMF